MAIQMPQKINQITLRTKPITFMVPTLPRAVPRGPSVRTRRVPAAGPPETRDRERSARGRSAERLAGVLQAVELGDVGVVQVERRGLGADLRQGDEVVP